MDRSELLAKQGEFLFPCVATYYKDPVVLVRGEGTWASDMDGNRYLDFFGGILTVSLAHCQPDVTKAVTEQAADSWTHVDSVWERGAGPRGGNAGPPHAGEAEEELFHQLRDRGR